MERVNDPYHLSRFTEAQAKSLPHAKQELRDGKKTSHWMWFIFPQLKQLGYSSTAKYYGIENLEEAYAYYQHAELGTNLKECCELLLAHHHKTANQILGHPDDLKLKSSATLFLEASKDPVFQKILDQFFGGEKDEKTVKFLQQKGDF